MCEWHVYWNHWGFGKTIRLNGTLTWGYNRTQVIASDRSNYAGITINYFLDRFPDFQYYSLSGCCRTELLPGDSPRSYLQMNTTRPTPMFPPSMPSMRGDTVL